MQSTSFSSTAPSCQVESIYTRRGMYTDIMDSIFRPPFSTSATNLATYLRNPYPVAEISQDRPSGAGWEFGCEIKSRRIPPSALLPARSSLLTTASERVGVDLRRLNVEQDLNSPLTNSLNQKPCKHAVLFCSRSGECDFNILAAYDTIPYRKAENLSE